MPRRVQISFGSRRRRQRGRRPEAPRTTPLARLPALRQPRSASPTIPPAARPTFCVRNEPVFASPPTCEHLPLAIGSHEQLRGKPPQSGQALASPIVLLLACAMQRRSKATSSAISAPARGAVSEPCSHSAASMLAVLPGALLSAACGARDERVGLYSCSCDAVIEDILAADRGLSMCGRGCAVTTDWSGDGQADLHGDCLA